MTSNFHPGVIDATVVTNHTFVDEQGNTKRVQIEVRENSLQTNNQSSTVSIMP